MNAALAFLIVFAIPLVLVNAGVGPAGFLAYVIIVAAVIAIAALCSIAHQLRTITFGNRR